MRTITDHVVNGLTESIEVTAQGEPGPGGANHKYHIGYKCGIHVDADGFPLTRSLLIRFQNGPIASPKDFNGVSNEAILAVLIDRIRGFQFQRNEDGSFDYSKPGKFACVENMNALFSLQDALRYLKSRTEKRMARGVEGSLKP